MNMKMVCFYAYYRLHIYMNIFVCMHTHITHVHIYAVSSESLTLMPEICVAKIPSDGQSQRLAHSQHDPAMWCDRNSCFLGVEALSMRHSSNLRRRCPWQVV